VILEIPSALKGIGYYEGLHLILYIVVITLFFFCASLFILYGIKADSKETKEGFFAYGLFFVFFAFHNIFYIISFYIPEDYEFYTTLGYIFALIAMIFILYVLETQVITFTKKMLTILTIIILFICIIALIGVASREFAYLIINTLPIILVVALMSIYIYLIVNSDGRTRIKAAFIFIGILLIYLSETMDSEWFIGTFPAFPIIIIPIIMILGTILFTYFDLFYSTTGD
jgi:hypothetical protein